MFRQSSFSGRPPLPTAVPAAPMSPPAQQTRMSICPKRSRTSFAARCTSCSSVTSHQQAIVSPGPDSATSAATCSIDSPSPNVLGLSCRVPWTATLAPRRTSSSAITLPSPLDEPVIHAVCPARGAADMSWGLKRKEGAGGDSSWVSRWSDLELRLAPLRGRVRSSTWRVQRNSPAAPIPGSAGLSRNFLSGHRPRSV